MPGETLQRLARRQEADATARQLIGQMVEELEDAAVGAMVLAEGLEVPADEDEIAPGLAQPVRVAVGGEGPGAPTSGSRSGSRRRR